MSINENPNTSSNFRREFGRMTSPENQTAERATASNTKASAKLWINVGIAKEVIDPNTQEVITHFTALPMGMPLDTMSKLDVKGGTDDYRARLTAQNDLLDSVLKAAESIAPGETKVFTIGDFKGLAVQIRRAKAEAAPIDPENNQYSVALDL